MKITAKIKEQLRKNAEKKVSRNNKRARKKKAVANLKTGEYIESLEFFEYACCYCEKEVGSTMEHVEPLSEGGKTTKDNCIPCCPDCNSDKQSEDLMVWFPQQRFFTEEKLEKIIDWHAQANEELDIKQIVNNDNNLSIDYDIDISSWYENAEIIVEEKEDVIIKGINVTDVLNLLEDEIYPELSV